MIYILILRKEGRDVYFGNVHFYLKKKKMNLGFKRYIFRKRGGEVFKEFFLPIKADTCIKIYILIKKKDLVF